MGNFQEAYKRMEQEKKLSDVDHRVTKLEKYNRHIDELYSFVDRVLNMYERNPPTNYCWTEIDGQQMIVWSICRFGGTYNDENLLLLTENGRLITQRGTYFGNSNDHILKLVNPHMVDLKKITDIKSHVLCDPLQKNLIETTYVPYIEKWIKELDNICQYTNQVRVQQREVEVKQQKNFSLIINVSFFVFSIFVIVALFNSGHWILLLLYAIAAIFIGMFLSS